ncbi:hypothetical protein [Amphibacillus sediminis]|uniref:hypothetical protein n=1 Tax=Amphibacillus sediminis TaxID=360185 RepID=UPI00082CA1EC|nr:hypothetical protein [Amphibacillus sediminis]
MILTEWKDFGTDAEYYTQFSFEQEVNDQFEAMSVQEGKDIPNLIWTKQYVVVIKNNTRLINDVTFIKFPRNPSVS